MTKLSLGFSLMYACSSYAQTSIQLDPKFGALGFIKYAEERSQVQGDKIRLRRMATKLRNAQLKVAPTDSEWQICQDSQNTWAAFVDLNKLDNIYLCRKFYDLSVFAQTQVLIHESAHLSGVKNECHADLWAETVMKFNGIPNQVNSGYDCPD